MTHPIALTIAGSDPSGGAGIQADLKAFSALGVYGASVIAALAAENTREVIAVHFLPRDIVEAQLVAVFADIPPQAIKIGMLGNTQTVETVARFLKKHPGFPIVLDPVMVAKSGDKLLEDDAIAALREQLLPLATLITPNLPEAAELLGRAVESRDDMEAAARDLLALGCKAVLLKGGHLAGDTSEDVLVTPTETHWFSAPRHDRQIHGTGCTLSAAIAAGIAKGLPLKEAVQEAKSYISAAIAAGPRLGVGHGNSPAHHFHAWW